MQIRISILILLYTFILSPKGLSQTNKKELPADNQVYISEVLYDTPLPEDKFKWGNHHNGEYIELYNPTDRTIDISGWFLKGYYPREYYKIPPQTIIDAKSYIIIAYRWVPSSKGDNIDFSLKYLFPDLIGKENGNNVKYQNKIEMSNKGERIILYNSKYIPPVKFNITIDTPNIIDQITYHGADLKPKSGEKRLVARNGNRGHYDAYTGKSLHRIKISKDNQGLRVYSPTDWQVGKPTPLGVELVTPGFDYTSIGIIEDEFIPTNDKNVVNINVPPIAPIQEFAPSVGDYTYSYDNAGNRIDKIAYSQIVRTLSSPNTKETLQSDNQKLGKYSIYFHPNPTYGDLTIDIEGFTTTTTGKLNIVSFKTGVPIIKELNINNSTIEVDISRASPDIYILLMELDGNVASWKIMKL